jgi:hypothetical protein
VSVIATTAATAPARPIDENTPFRANIFLHPPWELGRQASNS